MSIISLVLCYHIVFIHATNDTDQHSNQTTVELSEVFTTLSSITEEMDVANATIIESETIISNVTEEVSTILVTFNETTSLPDISTVMSTTEQEIVELNTTQEDIPTVMTTTEFNLDNQTIESVNTSCSLFKFGCCADGVTERTGMSHCFLEYLS